MPVHANSQPRKSGGFLGQRAAKEGDLAAFSRTKGSMSLGGSLSRGPRVLRRLKWINMFW